MRQWCGYVGRAYISTSVQPGICACLYERSSMGLCVRFVLLERSVIIICCWWLYVPLKGFLVGSFRLCKVCTAAPCLAFFCAIVQCLISNMLPLACSSINMCSASPRGGLWKHASTLAALAVYTCHACLYHSSIMR